MCVLCKLHNHLKNAKSRCDLGSNDTFTLIMSLNVTRSALMNKGFVTLWH